MFEMSRSACSTAERHMLIWQLAYKMWLFGSKCAFPGRFVELIPVRIPIYITGIGADVIFSAGSKLRGGDFLPITELDSDMQLGFGVRNLLSEALVVLGLVRRKILRTSL